MAEAPSSIAFISKESMKLLSMEIGTVISNLQSDIRNLNNNAITGFNNIDSGISVMRKELLAQMLIEVERLSSVKNEITRTIEVDAQANILEHISNLSKDLSLIHSAFQRVKKEHQKTFTRLARINSKFNTANEQVKESYVKDITRLGKYIFEVWELHYFKTIYRRLKNQHVELFRNSTSSMVKIKSTREEIISDLLKRVDAKVKEFEKVRSVYELATQSIKSGDFSYTGPVELPVTIVDSGQEKTYFYSDLFMMNKSSEDKIKVQILEKLPADMSKMPARVTWRKMSEDEIRHLEKNLVECSKQGFITEDYMNFLVVALKNNPPLTVESAKK